MRLQFGKSDWVELEPVPLESRVERGVRFYLPRDETGGRAAVIANRVTALTFDKAVRSYATAAEREAIGAKKVKTAVFRDPSGALRVIYREVIIRFEPAVPKSRRKALLAKFGLEIRKHNPFHERQLIAFDAKRKYVAERVIELANKLTETDDVTFAFPNFVSEFKRDAVQNHHKEQWHLDTVDARKAWSKTMGKGVTVAILDDGVDLDHPNLKNNIRRKPDSGERRDLYGRDFYVEPDALDHFDPRPKRFQAPYHIMEGNDIHGTCCAGVVAASGSVDNVRGVAPQASLLAVKIFHADDLATESHVANAIRYATRFADILSCSWSGPASPDIESALEEAGAGRRGKGSPVFCATGNEYSKTVAYPARSEFAIAVGASTDRERHAEYSNTGAEVSFVAPSSDGLAIFTTDVSYEGRGFNTGSNTRGGVDGLHANDFGGTSSATPLAAGIAALVLSVNPGLTRAEVRDVLEQTAKKIGPKTAYDTKGHSREYGYGRVNALAAIEEASRRSAVAEAAAEAAPRPSEAPPGVHRKTAKKRTTARKRRATG
jgi:subtilisin family serine protease